MQVFSIETQTTIGYGAYKIEEGCNLGVSALVLQSVVSSLLDAGLLGLVFAKLARPRSRRNTILYSEKACIAQAPEYNSNDGDFYLTFRLGDIRKSHILEAHVRAQVQPFSRDEGGGCHQGWVSVPFGISGYTCVFTFGGGNPLCG